MVEYLKTVNPTILIFLATSLFAFMSWILKSIVENPINEAKSTFIKFFEKRVEILSEVKVKLTLIMYFPDEQGNEIKESLQNLLQQNGKAAYINKSMLDSILRITIEPNVPNHDSAEIIRKNAIIKKIIDEIDVDLTEQIKKVKDEVDFYKRFSHFHPFKRFLSLILLSFQYIFSLTFVIAILFILIYATINFEWYGKIFVLVISLFGIYLTNKWIKK